MTSSPFAKPTPNSRAGGSPLPPSSTYLYIEFAKSRLAPETLEERKRYFQSFAETHGLPRMATAALRELLKEKQPVVVLTGPALSGKTNVVSELCWLAYNGSPEVRGRIPLYINSSQKPQGLFRLFFDGLIKQTKVPASADEVRQWLTVGLVTTEVDRPVVILDGWPTAHDERWKGELSELLGLVGDASFSRYRA